jgi:hypothetical protein
MDKSHPQQSFGVFKPVGHIVISFPSHDAQTAAADALCNLGLADGGITSYTPGEMIEQIDRDIERASPLAAVGQELNLVKAQRALAANGYHWLVVAADSDDLAQGIADTCKAYGAERAQRYGRFIIEELIEHAEDETQVAESPDRGLDAQTSLGLEEERVHRQPY